MSQEKQVSVPNGWVMLVLNIAVLLAGIGLFVGFIVSANAVQNKQELPNFYYLGFGIFVIAVAIFLFAGHFTLQPNEARVSILFGAYRGTVRKSGFHWTNPLNTKQRISLRARNFNGEILKVNDKRGNPIEIAAVVVWRVQDTAQASFDVQDYVAYVKIQSESAVRHLANRFCYDHGDENEPTLRSSVDEVSGTLQRSCGSGSGRRAC